MRGMARSHNVNQATISRLGLERSDWSFLTTASLAGEIQ
jgi:hypothetical protein